MNVSRRFENRNLRERVRGVQEAVVYYVQDAQDAL